MSNDNTQTNVTGSTINVTERTHISGNTAIGGILHALRDAGMRRPVPRVETPRPTHPVHHAADRVVADIFAGRKHVREYKEGEHYNIDGKPGVWRVIRVRTKAGTGSKEVQLGKVNAKTGELVKGKTTSVIPSVGMSKLTPFHMPAKD